MANVLHIDQLATENHTKTSSNRPRHIGVWSRFVMYLRAKRQAKKIMQGLNEAEQIHAGRLKGKSFNDFLKEI